MSRHRFMTNINKRSTGSYEDSDEEDDYNNEWSGSPSSASPATMALYSYDRSKPANKNTVSLGNFVSPQKKNNAKPTKDDDDDSDIVAPLIPQVLEIVGGDFTNNEVAESLRKNNYDVNRTVSSLLDSPSPQKPTKKDDEGLWDMDFEEKKPTAAPIKKVVDTKDVPAISNLQISEKPVVVKTKKEEPPAPVSAPVAEKKPQVTGVKQMSASRRKEIEQNIKNATEKEHINLIVIGHVDAGKSTLMGHMLYLLGNVSDKLMHRYEKDSKTKGKGSFAFAWVLDEHEEERNRGITMDVGITTFETKNKRITLLDAPGHRDFVPNMISGAAQADVAILVIDAIGFEAGFENDGQTREHVLLAKSLGVSQIGVVINKLDLVQWSKDRYEAIVSKLGVFLKQTGFKSPWFLPISGLSGENMVERKEPKLTEWFEGPTLLSMIDEFKASPREITKPLRICISDIYKGNLLGGIAIGGKVESGYVSTGDKLLVMPLNEVCSVKAIRSHGNNVEHASAGENVDVGLVGIEMSHLSIGQILCDPENPVTIASKFKANIVTFALQKPILKGSTLELYQQSISEPAVITELTAILDKVTGEVTKKKPRALGEQQTAIVEIKLNHPICLEKFSDIKSLGRFTLRESGRTVAAGIINEIFV